MVCFHFHSSITVNQHTDMGKSETSSIDPCLKLKQINQVHRNKKANNSSNHSFPDCEQSRSAMVDVVILIAVICACGFLLFPYAKLVLYKSVEISGTIIDVMREEVLEAPMIYGCLGLSIFCAVIAFLAITVCTFRNCGKPGCRGLRNAAEFDIQIEAEECVKSSNNNLGKDGFLRKGLFELHRDHHRELEAELKKMAPPNGRVVLVFRARCGCSVGRMEVPGPKKTRKVKK